MRHTAVWAPDARRVSMSLGDGSQLTMTRDGDGWWTPRRPLVAGQRYGFLVDGEGPFPDPRSLSLPDGVHGLTRVVDEAVFRRPLNWAGREVLGWVLYELHVGTFTREGTLDAAAEKLTDLAGLGIDSVELMPLAAFPGRRGWGYDGVSPWSVHESYGGPEALVRFVDAAHALGICVLIDIVYNHLGPEGAYASKFGPYFTAAHQSPWGDGINLDGEGCEGVRDFLLGSARHFLVDVGVDGLRLDAVHALRDESKPHFLQELAREKARWQEETGRPLTLIAESDLNRPSMLEPVRSNSEGLAQDGQWADDVHHALHAFFARDTDGYYVDFGTPTALVKALTRIFVHDGTFSTFRGKAWGAPVDTDSPDYDGHSFVVFLQNHDQVGNRALGDRFAQQAGDDAQAAAAALYLLGACTPMLFMGEEWAAGSPFPFFSELGPELGPLVTQGRMHEFAAMGWTAPTPDPQSGATFDSAILDWGERGRGGHARMLAWYTTLISLRRSHQPLRDPRLAEVSVEVPNSDTVSMRRGPFRVVAARKGVTIEVGPDEEILASWDPVDRPDSTTLTLPGPGAVILRDA